ncbi:tRNA pseudouridine synthase C [Kushneria marisflavi]|nr:tRNA pseudouridine synthase C [Kushneria marisflavi]
MPDHDTFMTPPIPVIYRDDHLVVVHKPSGALVHRSALDRHAPLVMLQALRNQLGQHVYPVHRLDRPTSGALLFALTPEVATALGHQFQQQQVQKRYLAIVRGIGPEQAIYDWALREEDGKRPKAEMPAMEAETHVRRLDSVELPIAIDRYPTSRYSLMSVTPTTGRRHQIRRHLSRGGYPIIGDARHGKGIHNRYFRDNFETGRLLLAAVTLEFHHPVLERTLRATAAVEEDMAALMHRFGWAGHCPLSHVQWPETLDTSDKRDAAS